MVISPWMIMFACFKHRLLDYQFPHTAFGKAEELQSSDDSSRASDYKAAKSRKMTRLVDIGYYYIYYI